MIRTRGLTKRYGANTALDRVDLDVPAGSVYGLVGPNGAGKTTLLSILAGLRRATSGEVAIDARESRRAVLPDSPRFERWLTAREVVDLAATLGGVDDPAAVARLLAAAGFGDDADRPVGGFSRGMLQRLGIAATVVADPEVVLLDEPAAALDPAGRREVLDLVERMRGAATVVFSSHILADVQAVCDRVAILDRGVLRFEGAVEELLAAGTANTYLIRVRSGTDVVERRLEREAWVQSVNRAADRVVRIVVRSPAEAELRLVKVLADTGVPIVAIEPEALSLEQVFLEVTR